METLNERFPIVALLTNGSLVTKEMAKKLATYSNLRGVSTSIHSASPHYHHSFVGQEGTWEKAWGAVRVLVKYGIPVRIAMAITASNLREVEKLLRMAKRQGAYQFAPQLVYPIGSACLMPAEDILFPTYGEGTMKDIYKLIKIIKKNKEFLRVVSREDFIPLYRIRKNCGIGHAMWTIDPQGFVRPCTMMPKEWCTLGNIFKESVDDIKTSSKMFTTLMAPHPDICSECQYVEFCKGCVLRGLLMSQRIAQECVWFKIEGEKVDWQIKKVSDFKRCGICSG